MKRRTVLAGGVSLALVGLASSARAARDPMSGKLSIWLGYGETGPAFRLALPAFKEMYPNVQVEILSFDLHEYEADGQGRTQDLSEPVVCPQHDPGLPQAVARPRTAQAGGVVTASLTPAIANHFGWSASFLVAAALCSAGALAQASSGDRPVVRQTVRFWRASSRASSSCAGA